MAKEIIADRCVSPLKKGFGLKKKGPVSIQFSEKTGKILSLQSLSKKRALSLRKPRARLVLPGLVDGHTHLVHAGNRSSEWGRRLAGETYEQISKKGGGIQTTVRETRGASTSQLYQDAKKRAKKMLQFGVTTLELKTGYGLDFNTEIKLLNVGQRLKKSAKQDIFLTYLAAHAASPEFSTNQAYIDHIIEHHLPYVQAKADFQDVFVERGFFSKRDGIRLLNAGKKFGLRPKVHAHEFGRTGGVEVAATTQAVSADHLHFLNDQDLDLLRKARVVPVILPGTSVFLGAKKFAPARKIIDSGLPLAIASDFNPGTNPSLNFPLTGFFAAMFESLKLEEIFVAQTRNAALALGLKDRGLLEKDYRADFLCIDAQNFEEIYYHYGTSLVEQVYVQGKRVS